MLWSLGKTAGNLSKLRELERDLLDLRLALSAVLRSLPEGKVVVTLAAQSLASTQDVIAQTEDPVTGAVTLQVRG